ncbi:MAG TPA: adenylate/guanylate cyclase domain-containing protein, partial [Acidimicrobiales bacterium]|nr:adenylate/guanylate cyclase domain-containing protein [Acidimicrobiales bacterium]
MAVHGEERRIVTVVFADMVGFTSLAERRDPEQVKHLVDRCFQWMTAEIVTFGGRVDKIIGDAVLALFGAPVAHEDDAERAVRAALRMQEVIDERTDELGGVVRLRIGVNTGEVLVGALNAGGDYTAMGDVVNTANRLQTAAQPGEVLVGSTTHAATERVIPYVERGVVPAKGREEPV